MEAGQVYKFSDAQQFWSELVELLNVRGDASLEEMDYATRNYVQFVARYMDEYLNSSSAFDSALFTLLGSAIFRDHVDRMTDIVISFIDESTDPAALFVALVLILHLGMSNPLSPSTTLFQSQPDIVVSNSKVFKALRRRWETVTPVLKQLVGSSHPLEHPSNHHDKVAASSGWEERLGTTACAVLYEICRVQKLTRDELRSFDYDFVVRLFALVEQTRNAEDETFNYLLIKLLIALNEQFMVAVLPQSADTSHHGNGSLPPPLEPVVKHDKPDRSQLNLVLEILKNGQFESKTFGENVIFILNRANSASDSLSVSLLILKLLYLLFTTSSTAEYFYTNDLCVLVDVFIRELSDLGPESEGLRHTYLRVLHPLMTNTQLRHYPYKRDLLYKVLKGLISHSNYQVCDATTRRLVERNLKSSWCEAYRANDSTCPELPSSSSPRRKSATSKSLHPTDNVLGQSLSIERVGSSVSLNAIADAIEVPHSTSRASTSHRGSVSAGSPAPPHRPRTGSIDTAAAASANPHLHHMYTQPRSLPTSVAGSPRSHSPAAFLNVVDPVGTTVPSRARSSSLSSVPFDDTASTGAGGGGRRRRAAPPPPTDYRPRTPVPVLAAPSPLASQQALPVVEHHHQYHDAETGLGDHNHANANGTGTGKKRRAAPLPPVKRFDDLRLS